MIPYPQIDPIIFSLGPLKVRWYGLMYVLGFMATFSLVNYQVRRLKLDKLAHHVENLNLVLILSLILGARIGYIVFYNLPYYSQHPSEIFAVWMGGMSFHGALIGVIIGGFIYCRKNKLNFWQVCDIYVVTVPIGLGLGRLGNFINGELFGRVTDVPWAMVFPGGGPVPRHPSQLYEFFLEGVVLFSLLWILKSRQWQKNWPQGSMVALFLIFYGIFRSMVEFVREPDTQLGFIIGTMTMGQILSICMIVAGLTIMIFKRGEGYK